MHDQPTRAPGGPADTPTRGRTATIRAIVGEHLRPTAGAPMDGTAAPAAPAPAAAPTTGSGGTAPAPAAPVAPATRAAQPAFLAPAPVPASPSAQPAPASPVDPAAAGAPVGQPPVPTPGVASAQPAAPTPVADRPLDQYPEDVRGYIKDLRKEAGDHRMAAKKAADDANARVQGLIDGVGKALGFMPDVPADTTVPPEQQVAKLTEQLTGVQSDHRDTRVELAVWKCAHAQDADPGQLTDSRAFMKALAGLDPDAQDFETKLTDAIGAALASNPHYRKAPPPPPLGEVPPVPAAPVPPPVPSSGEFAGGTGAADTEPKTVDDFRVVYRESKRTR